MLFKKKRGETAALQLRHEDLIVRTAWLEAMTGAFGSEVRPLYLEAEEQLAAQAAAKAANGVRPSFAHKSGFTGKGKDERAVLLQKMTEEAEAEAVRAPAAASQAADEVAEYEVAAAVAAPDVAPSPRKGFVEEAEPSATVDDDDVLDMHDDDDAAAAAPPPVAAFTPAFAPAATPEYPTAVAEWDFETPDPRQIGFRKFDIVEVPTPGICIHNSIPIFHT